jgi:protease-4
MTTAKAGPNPTAGNWERETLERLVFATVREQRAARRWGIFFKLVLPPAGIFRDLGLFRLQLRQRHRKPGPPHRADRNRRRDRRRRQRRADTVIPSLNKAFADAGSAAVVLRIDSPGGSPVQAGIIVDEIQRLKRGYPNKPLYVVVDEICASGGYYIAAAADKIYVNKASIVGSVGVLMDGFGFTGPWTSWASSGAC